MNVDRRKDFDGFTYEHLTDIILHGLKRLREYKQFKYSKDSQKYPTLKSSLFLKSLTWEREIKEFMKMRRLLKASALDNWDTDFFETQEKILEKLVE